MLMEAWSTIPVSPQRKATQSFCRVLLKQVILAVAHMSDKEIWSHTSKALFDRYLERVLGSDAEVTQDQVKRV